ncbi:ImmA/IrrE family metallo-endopeptidase [Nitriliruptoria bacterium AS10]|nr:ImmA/IrrE family metallo-endopeptidase [Salsipaludibacter albus]
MTKRALAEAAGVSTRSLSAYESDNADQEPSSETVRRLAEALGFPESYFTGPDLPEPRLAAASFRALSTLTARQQKQAFASAWYASSLATWIDDQFVLPSIDVPKLTGVDPETAAEAVRQEWGLGQRPVSNMIHLLEAHGTRVFSLADECAEIDAYSFWNSDGLPYVFLNTLKTAERSRMDAAHELGHLVLHWGHDRPRGRAAETEAKRFGSAFLMPRGSVLAEARAGARLSHLIQDKRRWGVSAAALAYRMHDLGLLSDWQYRSVYIELSEQGFRKTEPNGMQRESSQVLLKVFGSLADEQLGRTHVAETLQIPVAELDKVVFGLALTPVGGDIPPRAATSKSGERHLRLVGD